MNPNLQPLSQVLDPVPECGAIEQHYSASAIARRLEVSKDTVIRLFRDEPGVVRLGIGKKHEAIRIPESVLRRVLARRAVQVTRLDDKRRTPRIGAASR